MKTEINPPSAPGGRRLLLLRHGATEANLRRCYIGRIDEPLCAEGIRKLSLTRRRVEALSGAVKGPSSETADFSASVLAVSPMLRTMQTALSLFQTDPEPLPEERESLQKALARIPGMRLILVPALRECDFGAFEGRSYRELAEDPQYQAWIDSGGTLTFPGGENPEAFRRRCREGLCGLLRETGEENVALVVHGGTVMSIMEAFGRTMEGERRAYYDWHVDNGEGYLTEIVTGEDQAPVLRVLEEIRF